MATSAGRITQKSDTRSAPTRPSAPIPLSAVPTIACRATSAPGPRQLLLEHPDQPDVSTSTSPMPRATPGDYGGNVVGAVGGFIGDRHLRSDRVVQRSTSTLASPARRRASRSAKNERPLVPGSQLYFSLGSEIVAPGASDQGRRRGHRRSRSGRFDLTPQIRYPFKRWRSSPSTPRRAGGKPTTRAASIRHRSWSSTTT